MGQVDSRVSVSDMESRVRWRIWIPCAAQTRHERTSKLLIVRKRSQTCATLLFRRVGAGQRNGLGLGLFVAILLSCLARFASMAMRVFRSRPRTPP